MQKNNQKKVPEAFDEMWSIVETVRKKKKVDHKLTKEDFICEVERLRNNKSNRDIYDSFKNPDGMRKLSNQLQELEKLLPAVLIYEGTPISVPDTYIPLWLTLLEQYKKDTSGKNLRHTVFDLISVLGGIRKSLQTTLDRKEEILDEAKIPLNKAREQYAEVIARSSIKKPKPSEVINYFSGSKERGRIKNPNIDHIKPLAAIWRKYTLQKPPRSTTGNFVNFVYCFIDPAGSLRCNSGIEGKTIQRELKNLEFEWWNLKFEKDLLLEI
jgi:hypothetical protein